MRRTYVCADKELNRGMRDGVTARKVSVAPTPPDTPKRRDSVKGPAPRKKP
jgi:hypothetical protein